MMHEPAICAVLWGGRSPEAESSKASAQWLSSALARQQIAVELVEFSTSGIEQLAEKKWPTIPVTHGGAGEDGSLQGALELFGIPYVGSRILASAIAMHKPTCKAVLAAAGLPTVKGAVCRPSERLADLAAAHELGAELVLKPTSGGSSQRVLVCHGLEEAEAVRYEAFEQDEAVLIEPYLEATEVTVGVLATETGLTTLPPLDVSVAAGQPLTSVGDRAIRELEQAAQVQDRLAELATEAFEAVGCRHWARIDAFIFPDQTFQILEINTIPGLTPTSPFTLAVEAAGRELGQTFSSLLSMIYR